MESAFASDARTSLHAQGTSAIDANPPRRTADMSVEDWDTLFGAVTARLRSIAEMLASKLPHPHRDDATCRARDDVLQCVQALHQLHEELARERARDPRRVTG